MIEIGTTTIGCDGCGRTVKRRTLRFEAHLVDLPLGDAIQLPPGWRPAWRGDESALLCPTCRTADDARRRLGDAP